MSKKKTSFTLSDETLALLKFVAEANGISMSAALAILIRKEAKRLKPGKKS